MPESPLLSYIVLSYNYEHYIRTSLESIIAQSIQDFEIVVVDDASTDNSVQVVASFDDPRIRLLQNDENIGGAASYNRAVEAARGAWLVNLDADDWIAPTKAAQQLAAVRRDPELDVLGTYVSVRDEHGAPHTSSVVQSSVESFINMALDLNLTDSWIGANHLCRSSTMVRATAHRRIGLDDPDMVRAPDYELWTRGLASGLHIGVVPEQLTFMRVHSRQVTHADPLGTFLEMSFAALRNLVPRCERLALHSSYAAIIAWAVENPMLRQLTARQAFRLIGMFSEATPVSSFREFRDLLESEEERPHLADLGRRCLALLGHAESRMDDLRAYLGKVVEARDYWHEQSDLRDDTELRTYLAAVTDARDYWRSRSEIWERLYLEEMARRSRRGPIGNFVERHLRHRSQPDRS